jgi:UDP-GlcNAc:undecaprenyl-phosphate GlcNAc-1-phosphate transferase
MMAGLLASIFPFLPPGSNPYAVPLLVFIAVWAIGLIDDVITLPSYVRFCVHIAAGAALWFAGWRPGWFRPSPLDLAAACLFVALIINAMNLLDGMDGLAAGTAAIVSAGFLIVSAGRSSSMGIALASSLLGISVGMLTGNAPPAAIFMGDSGSTLVGVVLAFLSLNWIRIQPVEHSIVVPLIFLTLPLADVVLAILRRARTHAALFDGDRRHFYDILLRRGWTVHRILEVSLGITCIFVFVGWLCARGLLAAGFAVGIAISGVAVAAYFLGSLQRELERA